MALSRKNYEAVADIFASERLLRSHDDWDLGHQAATSNLAEDLALYFAEDNPNFDRARFLAACFPNEAGR